MRLSQILRAPAHRASFNTDSQMQAASPDAIRAFIQNVRSSPITNILFEQAAWKDGKELRIRMGQKHYFQQFYINSTAEYDHFNHQILVNPTTLPRPIVIHHEMRHAWQAVAIDTPRYTLSDPYTHFMFKQIIEADAYAYSNIVYDIEHENADIPLTPAQIDIYVDRYRRNFTRFLFDTIFFTSDCLKVEVEPYKYSHLRTVGHDSHPFSWVFRGKEKPEQAHARPERVAELIEQLSIVGLTAQPVTFFPSDDARDITERLFELHSKHPVTAPKLAEYHERLSRHYGPR